MTLSVYRRTWVGRLRRPLKREVLFTRKWNVLDFFNRPDENPVANGWAGPITDVSANQLKVVSNQLAGVAGGAASYWSSSQYSSPLEIQVTAAVFSSGFDIFWNLRDITGTGVLSGYSVEHGAASIGIYRITANAYTLLGSGISDTPSAGDLYTIRHSADGTIQIYKNGTALGASQVDSTYDYGYVGLSLFNATGRWDDYRLAAATAPSIATPVDSYGSIIWADNPFAWWRCDNASGILTDYLSDHPLDSILGSPTYSQSAVANGTSGTSLLLNGTSDAASEINAYGLVSSTHFSVEAWIVPDASKHGSAGGYQKGVILAKIDSAGSLDQYGIDMNSDAPSQNKFGFYIRDSGGYKLFHGGNVDAAAGKPTHVAMTWDGTTLRGYVNGQEVGNVLSATPIAARDSAPFTIGADQAGTTNFMKGKIDEVAYYKTALSAARVLAHYQAGSPKSLQYEPRRITRSLILRT